MSKPSTVADVWTRFKYYVTLLNETDKFLRTNTGNYRTLHDALAAQTEGEFLPGLLGPIEADRAALSALVSQRNLSAAGAYFAREFGRVLGAPETGQAEIMERVRVYMAELGTPQTLNRREMTFGSVTAGGSNVGTGTIHKVTTDEYGYPIENVGPDYLTFRCIHDQNTTTVHEETFEVRGGDVERDLCITETGSGINTQLSCVSARNVTPYLSNPSFTSYTGSGATLDVTDWTLSSSSLFEMSTTTYKGYYGEDTGYSLKFLNNANVYQEPTETINARFDAEVPWFFGFAMYRDSSCDGTLTVQVGTNTRDITVSSQTTATWSYYTLPASLGQYNWYRNWKAASPDVKFTLASRTTGYIFIDDICLYPMQEIGKHYYIGIGGATSFLLDDVFTVTNELEATRAKIAYWAWRMGWPNFPTATGAAEVVTDPADPS